MVVFRFYFVLCHVSVLSHSSFRFLYFIFSCLVNLGGECLLKRQALEADRKLCDLAGHLKDEYTRVLNFPEESLDVSTTYFFL